MRMTLLVVSFNRYFFAIAIVACVIGIGLMAALDSAVVRALLGVGVAVAIYFMIASVLAAYVVYDASDLYKVRWWPGRCLPRPPADGILVHAGFNPASASIRAASPRMRVRVLDFFDPATTTEASIQRAHRSNPTADQEERIAATCWPVEAGSQDAVFALSAAHELRKRSERIGRG